MSYKRVCKARSIYQCCRSEDHDQMFDKQNRMLADHVTEQCFTKAQKLTMYHFIQPRQVSHLDCQQIRYQNAISLSIDRSAMENTHANQLLYEPSTALTGCAQRKGQLAFYHSSVSRYQEAEHKKNYTLVTTQLEFVILSRSNQFCSYIHCLHTWVAIPLSGQ